MRLYLCTCTCPDGINSHKPKEDLLEPIHPLEATFVMPLLFPQESKFSGQNETKTIKPPAKCKLWDVKAGKKFYSYNQSLRTKFNKDNHGLTSRF